jgi:2-C-methyl-D-erythritol 4-phosphate cytidylyltransferase
MSSPSQQNPRFWAVIPAAGIGKRLGGQVPKQYLALHDKPVILHSVVCLTTHPLIHQTIVIVAREDTQWPAMAATFPTEKIITAIGGAERHISVYQGLLALEDAKSDDWVLVHDAVRPCLKHADIDRLIATLRHHHVGGLLGIRVRDTLKRTDSAGYVVNTIDRENMWQAQTPQMFRYGMLLQALKSAIEKKQHVTDEANAIELIGEQPLMVEGSENNIKITYPEDLARAETLRRSQ